MPRRNNKKQLAKLAKADRKAAKSIRRLDHELHHPRKTKSRAKPARTPLTNIARVLATPAHVTLPPAFRYPDGFAAPTFCSVLQGTFELETGTGGGCAFRADQVLNTPIFSTDQTNASGVVSWGTAESLPRYTGYEALCGSARVLAVHIEAVYIGPRGSALEGSVTAGDYPLGADSNPGDVSNMATMFDQMRLDRRAKTLPMGEDFSVAFTAMNELGVESFKRVDYQQGQDPAVDNQLKTGLVFVADGPASKKLYRLVVSYFVEGTVRGDNVGLIGRTPAPLNVIVLNKERETISRITRGGSAVHPNDASASSWAASIGGWMPSADAIGRFVGGVGSGFASGGFAPGPTGLRGPAGGAGRASGYLRDLGDL